MASTVYYYTMDCRTEHQNKESKVARLCNLLKLKDIVVPGRPCAIKLHFGETGCDGHLNPQLVQAAVQKVREAGALPFLTDTRATTPWIISIRPSVTASPPAWWTLP